MGCMQDSFRSKEEMSHHSCYPSSELNEVSFDSTEFRDQAAVQSVAEELSSMTEVDGWQTLRKPVDFIRTCSFLVV